MLRIIDNKRIDLTNEEWTLYQKVCESYDVERRGIKGKDLFSNLFETDKKGIIIFLKPPQQLTSMEVYMFLVSIMIHQHLGVACDHVDGLVKKMDTKMTKLDELIKRAESLLDKSEWVEGVTQLQLKVITKQGESYELGRAKTKFNIKKPTR